MDKLCFWCSKKIDFSGKYVFIEGFYFCNEDCENKYYRDRGERKAKNKPTLSMERNST